MGIFTLKLKLIIAAVLAIALIGAGIWFRGVLADNKEMKHKAQEQKELVKSLNDEVERMNRQDAADHTLRQMIEIEKAQLSKDLATQQHNLKKAKELLDEATRNCLDLPLPQSYLDRLPQEGR